MIIGNAANEKQEKIEVNDGTNDRDFTVGFSNNNIAINESTVNVKTWKDALMKESTGK